ncbi:MAG: hypothetical protein ACRCZE_02450 [Candidatus Altimarinota bacterium]
MNSTQPKFLSKAFILIVASLFIAGCQPAGTGQPERPLNPNGKPVKQPEPIVEEIVPLLNMNAAGQSKEFKLRSQTSRYLNAEKSALEIVLTDNRDVSCQNPAPAMTADQQKITLTVKSKDGKSPIAMADLSTDTNFEKQAEYQIGETKTAFGNDAVTKLEFTNINDAIARGNLKLETTDLSLDGEFFTAICN